MTDDPYATPAAPPPLPARAPHGMGDDAGMRLLLPVGRSGWAIAAGYFGLFSLVLVPAPIAVVLAWVAIRDIRKSRENGTPKYGMGRAVFGLVMGLLFSVLLAIMLLGTFGQKVVP